MHAHVRMLCREAASRAKPLPHFGDAFAVASPFAASLLFGVQQAHDWDVWGCFGQSLHHAAVASKAHVASAYIEARTLKHEVLGSVNLCSDIKCSSTLSDISAILRALCTAVNVHFLSHKVPLSSQKKLAAIQV